MLGSFLFVYRGGTDPRILHARQMSWGHILSTLGLQLAYFRTGLLKIRQFVVNFITHTHTKLFKANVKILPRILTWIHVARHLQTQYLRTQGNEISGMRKQPQFQKVKALNSVTR